MFSQNSYVEDKNPTVVVFGDEALGEVITIIWSHEGGFLSDGMLIN